MTPTTGHAAPAAAEETRVIGLVSAAHLVSHYYILLLAPLFVLIRDDFGVSYTELGLALAAFNAVTMVVQTPAGFLVDRVSARAVLTGGLLIGAAALVGAATLPSFWAFVAMFGLLGLGNSAYHPAGYALLSQRVSPVRMGRAYSLHTFAGMVGSAAAPPALFLLASQFGWRGAFLASAALGFAVAALLIVFGDPLSGPVSAHGRKAAGEEAGNGASLLLSPPILINLAFFALLALFSNGVQNFSVVALLDLYGTPLQVSNTALSGYLAMSAAGVLAGGVLAARTNRHDHVAIASLVVFAAITLLIAFVELPALALVTLTGIAGLSNGVIMPARDLLVRAITPPGAFGKVFGFVTSGFNIGGIVSPLLFGWLLDHGNPRGVFIAAALLSLICIPTVTLTVARMRAR